MRAFPFAATFLILSLIGFGASTAHAQSEQWDEVSSPDATVHVDGMACPFCAYGIEKKLKSLDAIQQMEVQLEKGRILLSFKEGKSATKDEIRKAVEKAGFTARKIEFADEPPAEDSSMVEGSST